jgi:uncharacterized protein
MSGTLSPTSAAERIGVLDTTRGIAVLGILIMNIAGFGLPHAYEDPTNWGGDRGADLWVWRIAALFFEGTMRGLFTILFGAGALLFLQRHGGRSTDAEATKLYYRRTLWLLVFGLVNGYVLLWEGDILVFYGVIGLILLFCRNISARKLLLLAALIVALQTSVALVEYGGYAHLRSAAASAEATLDAGAPLTMEQAMTLKELEGEHDSFKPSREQLEEFIGEMRGSYASAFARIGERLHYIYTKSFMQHGFGDALSFMVLGMALLQFGVLTGAAKESTYRRMMLIGYAFGLAINTFEVQQLERSAFSVEALMRSYLTYDLGRVSMTFGHLGSIMLIYRSTWFAGAARVLAAVGKMALTNYLGQSLICLFLFTGAGLGWYGQLQRHELYYVVAAIWIVQLVFSVLWLRYFQFGPLEWLWRTLTYWQMQPMRRRALPTSM